MKVSFLVAVWFQVSGFITNSDGFWCYNVDGNQKSGSPNQLRLVVNALPETNSSHLKMDGWNTIVSFWGPAYFQVRLLLVSGSVSYYLRSGL